MNLQNFRDRIGGAIGMKTSAAGTERDLVDAWVNEAIVDFLRRTKIVFKTASMAMTADKGDYTLDTSILAMKELYYEPSGNQSVMLHSEDGSSIRLWRLGQTPVAQATPYAYALEGASTLMLFPTPASSSDKLHILYVPRPTSVLALTGDDPSTAGFGEIPKEFHQVLETYGKWKAADYADDMSSATGRFGRGPGQMYLDEYEKGILDAMKSTTLKAGVRLGPATVGRRRPRVARDVDDGS